MMKQYMNRLWMVAAAAAVLTGCSSSKESLDEEPTVVDDGKVAVNIVTDVQTKAAVVTTLTSGDKMNVYAKAYGQLTAADLAKNIVATNEAGSWKLSPEVRISKDEHAFIYAVYPYDAANTDPSAITIDLDKQVDVLYSGAYVPVSYTTNTAKLTMKHALALVTLNMVTQGYTKGQGQLQKIEVYGENIYTKGKMSVDKGDVSATDLGSVSASVSKTIQSSGWTGDLPRLWAIPFSTKVETTMLKATIDGTTYETRFPEVEVKKGYQYVFHLVLTDYGLEFIPDQTTSVSLNQEEDSVDSLENYGVLVITHKGTQWTTPSLLGDNVFGSISWGDGTSDSYAFGTDHAYSGTTEKQVVIESWNSTGFELKEMTDVTLIDISAY